MPPRPLRCLISYGMETMHLNRIEALYDLNNPASGRVMQKAGMLREGVLRQKVYNKGHYVDVCICSILSREYRTRKAQRAVAP